MRKMKNSGIEWIGKIPSDWDVTRIGYESWIRARLGWKGLKAEEYVDEGFAFLSAFNIVDDKLQWENLNFINQQRYDESPEIKLKKGDILLVKDGAGIGKCARIDSLPIGAATTNGSLAVISTHAKLSYRYLYFYLLSPIFQNYIYRLMNGMGVPHLSQEELRKIQIPFPPLLEQKKIADFLDEKCADIDQIRADIEKQIEILTDYKKSVITETVTKGLDPKVKLKDSGIEWIGKIPEGWDSIKAKYLFKQRNSRGNTIDLQLLSPSQKFGVIPQSKLEELTTQKVVKLNEKVNLAELKTIHKGDFCISLRSFQGGFEYSKYEGVVSPAYQVFYSIVSCCNGYYRYLFKEKSFIEKMNSFTMSLRDGKNIAFEDFANSEMPVPSLPEQKAIASYLDEKCSEIDATIAEKQKQLETLEEYKKSLIFEYVTGKKEVPT